MFIEIIYLYMYYMRLRVCIGCRSRKTPKAELNANWIKIDKKKTPKNKKSLNPIENLKNT